jgi:hypothetical protein
MASHQDDDAEQETMLDQGESPKPEKFFGPTRESSPKPAQGATTHEFVDGLAPDASIPGTNDATPSHLSERGDDSVVAELVDEEDGKALLEQEQEVSDDTSDIVEMIFYEDVVLADEEIGAEKTVGINQTTEGTGPRRAGRSC